MGPKTVSRHRTTPRARPCGASPGLGRGGGVGAGGPVPAVRRLRQACRHAEFLSGKATPAQQRCQVAVAGPASIGSSVGVRPGAVTGRQTVSRTLVAVRSVHGLVALGRPVEREGEVEDLAGVDLAVPDELDQVGQVLPDRGGAAVDVDAGHEELVAGDRDVVGDADEADVAPGAGGVDGLHHGFLGADGLDDRVRAEPAGELLDPGHAVVAALLDDVGGAELAGERLPVGVAAEGDDPLGAELLGGEDADAARPRRRRRPPRSCPGPASAATAANQPVPSTSEAAISDGIRSASGCPGWRRACRRRAGCGPARTGCRGAHEDAVHAVRLVAGPADLAGVVGGPEGADDEVADLDGADLGADLLDDADVLVAHHLVVDRLGAAVGPQVAAADAGRGQADDRVGRLDDLRVLAVLHPHVAGSVHDNSTHRGAPLHCSRQAGAPGRRGQRPTTASEPAACGGLEVPVDGCTDRAPFVAPAGGRGGLRSMAWTTVRGARVPHHSPRPHHPRPGRPPAHGGPDASRGCGAARSPRSPGSASSTTPGSSAARSPAPRPASSTRSRGPCSSTRPNAPTCSTSPGPPTASPPRVVPVAVRRARPRRGRACSGRSRRSPTVSRSSATRTRTCSPPTPSAARSTRP